jgi:hypothetical protein
MQNLFCTALTVLALLAVDGVRGRTAPVFGEWPPIRATEI